MKNAFIRNHALFFTFAASITVLMAEDKSGVESLRAARELAKASPDSLGNNISDIEENMDTAIRSGLSDLSLEWLLSVQLKSVKWMKIASDHGHPIASFSYALYLEENGSKPSDVFLLYLKSAELGYFQAQEKVGWYYENGISMQTDLTMAAFWYERASRVSKRDSSYKAASCYKILNDSNKYLQCLQIACDNGNAGAELELAKKIAEDHQSSTQKNLLYDYKVYSLLYSSAMKNNYEAMSLVGEILFTKGVGSLVGKDEILGGAFLLASQMPEKYQIVLKKYPIGSKDHEKMSDAAEVITKIAAAYPVNKLTDNPFDGVDPKYLHYMVPFGTDK